MSQDELLAVLTMMVDNIEEAELCKIAEKFVQEIDHSQVMVMMVVMIMMVMMMMVKMVMMAVLMIMVDNIVDEEAKL